MKRVGMIIAVAVVIAFSSLSAMGEQAPKEVIDMANSDLAQYGEDPIIVAAVSAENAKNKTLDQIKTEDEKWKNTPGLSDLMKSIADNPCSVHLRSMQQAKPYITEIFVMDNQGANVAMTDKTSDYWQGDEAKFQKSYNAGAGAVFVDEVKFDDSAQAYLVQVSVPVKEGGKAIGAITFGIDLDKLK